MANNWKARLVLASMFGAVWALIGGGQMFYFMFRLYRETGNTGTYAVWGIVRLMLMLGAVGMVGGLLFTALFARLEQGKSVATLSWWRTALWGGAAALSLVLLPLAIRMFIGVPFGLATFVRVAMEYALIGAGTSLAVLGIAKRGRLTSGEEPYGAFPTSDPPAASLTR